MLERSNKTLADFEPTMGRGKNGVDTAKLALDREILRGRAQAWGNTPTQKATLADGWAKAQKALLMVGVVLEGAVSDAPLICRAYGIDAVLALGGKGRAKKGLLELAAREKGVFAPWFAIGCEKILRDSALTLSFNCWEASRDYEAMRQAEGAMFDLSRPNSNYFEDHRVLFACASLKSLGSAPAMEKALLCAFGGDFVDLMPGFRPGDSVNYQAPAHISSQAVAWVDARASSIVIGEGCLLPEEPAAGSKPRL